MGVAAIIPLSLMAQGASSNAGEGCPPMLPAGAMFPMHGMPPDMPPMGIAGLPPHLANLSLTEAQQDQIFALTHDHVPSIREKAKAGFKALDELRRLTASDNFSTEKARLLAQTSGQAISEVILMHAELDAKVHALLTLEQRKQLDNANFKADAVRRFKGL